MARNSEEESSKGSEEEEGEDEALSLSDLPLNFINEETSLLQSSKEAIPQVIKENEEEFNFDSRGGSLSAESEMYAADELFFKGQMLPLRLSVSSDSGLLAWFEKDRRNNNSSISRSESLDRGIRNTTTNSRPKIGNQFHSFPSPKPQIRVSNARLLGNGIGSRSQKSTVWDLFRLGLVRAPEIELHNINSSVSRNSSSGSSSTTNNSSSSVIVGKNKQDLKLGKHKQQKKQSFLDKRKGLFSGCRCSIAAVETVPLNNIVIIKSNAEHESSSSSNNNKESNSTVQDMEKKLQELKIKNKIREKQQGKQAMSRHRTFEWLKELSHASFVDGNLLV